MMTQLRNNIFFLILLCLSVQSFGQNLDGEWLLDEIVLNDKVYFSRTNNELFGMMDWERNKHQKWIESKKKFLSNIQIEYYKMAEQRLEIKGNALQYFSMNRAGENGVKYKIDQKSNSLLTKNDSVISVFSITNGALKLSSNNDSYSVYKRKEDKEAFHLKNSLYQRVEKQGYRLSNVIKIFDDRTLINFNSKLLDDTLLTDIEKTKIADSLYFIKTKSNQIFLSY